MEDPQRALKYSTPFYGKMLPEFFSNFEKKKTNKMNKVSKGIFSH
jgi:hypothetical protein